MLVSKMSDIEIMFEVLVKVLFESSVIVVFRLINVVWLVIICLVCFWFVLGDL